MGLFDNRALAGGLAGALALTVLRQASRRKPSGLGGSLASATGAAAYYSLAGASSRPMLTGLLLGVGAGVGSALLPRRQHRAAAAASGMVLHTIAGLAAGAVYSGLNNDWPAQDFGEAFFP